MSLAATPTAPPEPAPREFRAVWVATVDNIDWPSRRDLTVPQMKQEMGRILDRCVDLNLNAVIFQVRPSADALYKSDLEPWSEYLTGQQGKAPAGGYDPLTDWVEESHKRGLELHVWLNPYRANHPAQKGGLAANHVSKKMPGAVKKLGDDGYMWMDPADKNVQDHSYAVFMDLVDRYDIDGIHIDDYFYPYPSYNDNKGFPDDASWSAYKASGGTLSRGDWRRKAVDDFVKRVYEGIKQRKRWVKFGISPFGIYRPGYPPGIQAGIDQYDELYADARLWLREGWLDYFTPQLYWPIRQEPQSFPKLLSYWASENRKGRHLWPGQFTSRLNPSGGNWKASEIAEQISLVRQLRGSTGTVHFSMKAFLFNWNNINEKMKVINWQKALVPESPWLDRTPPARPRFATQNGVTRVTSPSDDLRFMALYVKQRGRWLLHGVSTPQNGVKAPSFSDAEAMAVSVTDREGNESAPTVVAL